MSSAPDIAELPDAAALAVVDAGPPALASFRSRVNDFYELTKPRMNFLVLVTSAVGFYMGTRGGVSDWGLLLHALFGTALAAAGASVLNQYVEREHDAHMR